MSFWDRKIKGVSIILPTLNSEKRIGPLLSLLTRNFEDVVVGIDNKTVDNTLAVVQSYRCRVISIDNKENEIVEKMLGKFMDECKYDWILRLDDDELISLSVVKFLKEKLGSIDKDCVALHRKWCRKNSRGVWEWFGYPFFGFDWQYRLFRRDKVKMDEAVHTPGFVVGSVALAPIEAFIMHLNWVYRSYGERKALVQKYQQLEGGSGHGEYYLYEDLAGFEDYFLELKEESLKFVRGEV